MTDFRKNLKYNVKKEFIYYKKKLDSINLLIKEMIKLDNECYKLTTKKYYSNFANKVRPY